MQSFPVDCFPRPWPCDAELRLMLSEAVVSSDVGREPQRV